jgi:hypothetical protein
VFLNQHDQISHGLRIVRFCYNASARVISPSRLAEAISTSSQTGPPEAIS